MSAGPEFELIQPGSPLHTGLRNFLEAGYGVPRNSRRIVVIIEDGEPLRFEVDYLPETRKQPDYGAAARRFRESQAEKLSPSPFRKPPTPEEARSAMAEAMAGPPAEPVRVSPSTLVVPLSGQERFDGTTAPEGSAPWD